jgi:hypothetical protein
MGRSKILLFISVSEAENEFLTLLMLGKIGFRVISPMAQKIVKRAAKKVAILKRSRRN